MQQYITDNREYREIVIQMSSGQVLRMYEPVQPATKYTVSK